MTTLFPPGSVEISLSAASALSKLGLDADTFVHRHACGDWGDVDARRATRNEFAVHQERTIRSRYLLDDGTVLRVVTDPAWGVTSVMLDGDMNQQAVDVETGYNIWSQVYDKKRNPLIAVEAPQVEDILSDLTISTALDAATGTGRHALNLARRNVQVTAVDQSALMLKQAKEKAHAEGLEIRFEHARLESGLPFLDHPFDLVICALALCHVSDLGPIFKSFHRLLNPGGYILVTDFHPDVIDLGWETSFHTPRTDYSLPTMNHSRQTYIDAAQAAGFSITRVQDIPVKDVPEGYIFPEHIETAGERFLRLVLFGQKQ